MDTKILSLEKHLPHVVVPTGAKVHVYPVRYFRDLIAGEDVEPLPEDVLRLIVHEWLESIPEGNNDG